MLGGICWRLTRLVLIWREAQRKFKVVPRPRSLLMSLIVPSSAIHTGFPEPASDRQIDSGGFLRQKAAIFTYPDVRSSGIGI
jgi:hypothetical protein